MLIAIAIAEEIQGSKRITLVPEPSGGPPGLHAQNNKIFKEYGFMWDNKPKDVLAPIQSFVILCNPWISSAMAMAMSIYETLCVLVFLSL